jgi:hypothetical protein
LGLYKIRAVHDRLAALREALRILVSRGRLAATVRVRLGRVDDRPATARPLVGT